MNVERRFLVLLDWAQLLDSYTVICPWSNMKASCSTCHLQFLGGSTDFQRFLRPVTHAILTIARQKSSPSPFFTSPFFTSPHLHTRQLQLFSKVLPVCGETNEIKLASLKCRPRWRLSRAGPRTVMTISQLSSRLHLCPWPVADIRHASSHVSRARQVGMSSRLVLP